MNGRLDVVQMLLESGASPIPGDTDPKVAPLTLASEAGHTAIVEALLDANIPVNPKVELSHALIAASKNCHRTIVELLLKYGADPNFVGEDGITPFEAADQYKHEEVQMYGGRHGPLSHFYNFSRFTIFMFYSSRLSYPA
jgi:ankyrin repeat protein